MRKRRRTTGTWFPIFGENIAYEEGSNAAIWGRALNIDLNTSGVGNPLTQAQVIPVTFDIPKENFDPADQDSESLADIVGSEYFLRRIVGKFVFDTASNDYSLVKVAAGFFVSRTSRDGAFPVGWENQFISLPPASSQELEAWDNFSPLANKTIREPWIWRRTWLCECRRQPVADQPGALPYSNAQYGSVMDGPHLDAKTKRRITQDERLWFAWGATPFPYLEGPDEEGQARNISLVADLDIRIYASLRKARNRGVF